MKRQHKFSYHLVRDTLVCNQTKSADLFRRRLSCRGGMTAGQLNNVINHGGAYRSALNRNTEMRYRIPQYGDAISHRRFLGYPFFHEMGSERSSQREHWTDRHQISLRVFVVSINSNIISEMYGRMHTSDKKTLINNTYRMVGFAPPAKFEFGMFIFGSGIFFMIMRNKECRNWKLDCTCIYTSLYPIKVGRSSA